MLDKLGLLTGMTFFWHFMNLSRDLTFGTHVYMFSPLHPYPPFESELSFKRRRRIDSQLLFASSES